MAPDFASAITCASLTRTVESAIRLSDSRDEMKFTTSLRVRFSRPPFRTDDMWGHCVAVGRSGELLAFSANLVRARE